MQKQKIRDLILKSEQEIIEISSDDPLVIKGRKFLRNIPSYKIDYFLEKSSHETLSHLLTFFNFLMKRKDISLLEQERIRTFIKCGKIEKGARERRKNTKIIQEQTEQIQKANEKIEKQQDIIKGLHELVNTKSSLFRKEMEAQKEIVKDTQKSIKNCKLIILFLSALNCIEATTQITVSVSRRTVVHAKTVGKAILSAIIALWSGFSLYKKKS